MDSNSFFDMFKAMGKGMKVPGVDVDAILGYHRKNLETLEATAKMASAGATTLMDRQRELLSDALKQWTNIAQAAKSGNPQDVIAMQAELAKKSFETAVKSASEATDLVTKSGSAAFELVSQRVTEAFDEARKAMEKATKG